MILQTWHTIKGYAAGAVAFIACPCHLPITLPLLVALTAGTAFGRWLENNMVTVVLISTALFIGGLFLAFKWVGKANAPRNAQSAIAPHKTEASLAQSPSLASDNGLPQVTLLTSSTCASCQQAKAIWQQAREQVAFQFETVDIFSARGRDLAARHNVFNTPATVVNDEVVVRGIPKVESALAALGRSPQASMA